MGEPKRAITHWWVQPGYRWTTELDCIWLWKEVSVLEWWQQRSNRYLFHNHNHIQYNDRINILERRGKGRMKNDIISLHYTLSYQHAPSMKSKLLWSHWDTILCQKGSHPLFLSIVTDVDDWSSTKQVRPNSTRTHAHEHIQKVPSLTLVHGLCVQSQRKYLVPIRVQWTQTEKNSQRWMG